MTIPYTAPSLFASAFNCPRCGAYANQHWREVLHTSGEDPGYPKIVMLRSSTCAHCDKPTLWEVRSVPTRSGRIVWPPSSTAPLPVEDMPKDVREDFEEARRVLDTSPRAAAALLRVAVEKLMPHLGEGDKSINDSIKALVRAGLDPTIQKALDSLRVIGNNAVHPGQIDLTDDRETALALFDVLNITVEQTITRRNRIESVWTKIPQNLRDAIAKRDGEVVG